ncbi:MAG: tetratricopeptide repeat protein [Planctomycetaceae bacterium]|nr:tetratricopeptide repeat protein [Planctomycetaceae bacterium]
MISMRSRLCRVGAGAVLAAVLFVAVPAAAMAAATQPTSTSAATRRVGATTQPVADNTLDGCWKLHMSGRYDQAATGYRRLASAPEQAVSASIGLAYALSAQGQYAQAQDALQACSAAGAARAEWHLALGEVQEAVGQYEQALEHAVAAGKLKTDWAQAIWLQGRLLETLGRRDQAKAVYAGVDRILAGDAYRNDAPALTALGQILDRHAILSARKASEQAPNILHNYLQEAYQKADATYWPANLAAGMFMLSKHRPEGAAAEFALALKINPKAADAMVGMGIIALEQWQFERAIQMAEQALKVNPNFANALVLKAVVMMQWRKFDQVQPLLDAALKVNPNHIETLSLAAALAIRTNQPAQAQPFIDRVAKVNPRCADLPQTIGQWLSAARQFTAAEKYLRQAADLAPEQAEPLITLGLLYMQTGAEDKAREIFAKAHEIDDYRSDVVNYLGVLGDMEKFAVKETAHFIIKVDPKHDAVLLDQVAAYMEEIYPEITGDFAYKPAEKTLIEFFPLHRQFSIRITGKAWIGTVGASTGNVIVMVAPNKQRSEFGTYNWATVLRHEYTHTVTLAATNNLIPHWFTEACAVWQQPDRRNYDAVNMLVFATRQGRLMPIRELDWGFIRPKRSGDRSLAYAQAEWTMEYIIAKYKFDTVVQMLQAFRDGLTQAQVFQKVLKTTEAKFDDEFRAYAKADIQKWGFSLEPPVDLKKAAALLAINPVNAAAHAQVAKGHYELGNLPAALDAAKKALSYNPAEKTALAVLASVLAAQKNYAEAETVARKLEAVDKDSRTAPYVLANAYVGLRKWSQAIVALETLKLRRPLYPHSYQELARLYRQLGQDEKALPNLIELHRRTMNDPQYARQIAEICIAADKTDQALSYLRQVAQINPYEISAYESMAAIYRQVGQFDKAIEAIDNVCTLQPESADAWAKMAMMRFLAARATRDVQGLRQAREAAEKSLAIDKDSQARQVLALIDQTLQEIQRPQ